MSNRPADPAASGFNLTHLKQLEAESIHIMREVASEFHAPVMLYSIGKDSSVMVRLAQKAFYPAKPPFPLLHVDTTWKFREMIDFRERYARQELDLEVIVYINQGGLKHNIHPLDDSEKHTEVMKTTTAGIRRRSMPSNARVSTSPPSVNRSLTAHGPPSWATRVQYEVWG